MQRRHMLATLLALVGTWATGAQAHDHDRDREKAERLQAAGEVLPLQDVLARVAKDYPGQVLKVEFDEDDGDCQHSGTCTDRWVYKLKILQDQGRLVKIKVDARTGQVLWAGRRPPHDQGKHP
ncbi:PepSY domain-containing protein [Castellaniella sp.]|uniref:PepSY domain-containing protein n=1 Tax=Castellaniella sp. TaxID=1955812 RepID=UPI002AFEC3F8|nr:PepSY domain-containing protein [Castellaniella sp.]